MYVLINEIIAQQTIELWRDRGQIQIGLAKTCAEAGKTHEALTHCNWARDAFDIMDEISNSLQKAKAEAVKPILKSNLLYQEVEESFDIWATLGENQSLAPALQKNMDENGGAIVAQIKPGMEGRIWLEGTYFPPEFANKIEAVINEWRESRGIARRS